MGFVVNLDGYRLCVALIIGVLASIAAFITLAHADGPLDGMSVETRDSLGEPSPSELASVQEQSAVTIPAIEQADPESVAVAVGHYARARSLLIAALREFDKGTQVASPNAILNSKAWRKDIAERTEELNHILAPQPRASKRGMRYEANRRLLNTEANGN